MKKLVQLLSDEGKTLTDGTTYAKVVWCNPTDVDRWNEVDDSEVQQVESVSEDMEMFDDE